MVMQVQCCHHGWQNVRCATCPAEVAELRALVRDFAGVVALLLDDMEQLRAVFAWKGRWDSVDAAVVLLTSPEVRALMERGEDA